MKELVWDSNKVSGSIDRRAGERVWEESEPFLRPLLSGERPAAECPGGPAEPPPLTRSVFLTRGTEWGGSLKGASFIFLLPLRYGDVYVAALEQALYVALWYESRVFSWGGHLRFLFLNVNMLIS